jgi:hypothetical protein
MRLSDLIRALQHVAEEHGDLPVLERRQVFYDATELSASGIVVNARVLDVAAWHEQSDGRHHCHLAGLVRAGLPDRREFKAFVL